MRATSGVVIISAFGRGNWLAAELADSGCSVQLVDVSQQMGRWVSEDWEGPFGFFHSDDLKLSQIERLNEEDYYEPVNEGFTIWLKQGPVDLKGPLSSYYLERMGLKEVCEKYLINKQGNAKELSELDFSDRWLVNLAYQLASNTYDVDELKIEDKQEPLPIFSPYNVRRVSRRGAEKSLEWCESKGVSVLSSATIKDISVDGGRCENIEVESEKWSGVIGANDFVWMLTSEESARFKPEIGGVLYPKGVLASDWVWVRYRVQLGDESLIEIMPTKYVMLEDVFLPWTHENLCLVQKAVNNRDLDVWVKIPSQHRFQKSYIEALSEKIKNIFKIRVPNAQPELVDMPQDYLYDSSELGPTRFPVYDKKKLSNHIYKSFKNLHFENPETWDQQDWTGQFRSQNKLFDKIKTQFLQNKNTQTEVNS